MNHMPSKTMPKHCEKSMHRMYIRKGTEKRKWLPVGYFCDVCSKMLTEVEIMKNKELEKIIGGSVNLVEFENNPRAVVIDLGSCFTKVGVAGESKPRFIFDSAVYYSEAGSSFIRQANYKDLEKKSVKTIKIFRDTENIEEQIDLDDLEIFLTHIFDELEIKPNELPLLLVDRIIDDVSIEYLKGKTNVVEKSSLSSRAKEMLLAEEPVKYVNHSAKLDVFRRRLTLVLFDRLKITDLYFSMEEILSLYANDANTGVVVSIGNQNTRIVPIYKGYIICHAHSFRKVGGKDVVDLVKDEVNNQGVSMIRSAEELDVMQKNIRIASEELCYVSIDPNEEPKKWQNSDKLARSFRIIDDEFVTLEETRFQATEVLLQKIPLSVTKDLGNLAEAVVESIRKCDKDLVKDLYSNIILTGGASMYEGLLERFTKEIRSVAHEKTAEINVNLSTNGEFSGWIGGSILASVDILFDRKLWVTRDEYKEKGSSAVDRCF